MRVEPFSLNVVVTYQSESAVPAMLSCLFLGGLLNSGGCGKDPNLPVGENSVYIEQNELNLLGPLFGHGRILAFSRNHSPCWPTPRRRLPSLQDFLKGFEIAGSRALQGRTI